MRSARRSNRFPRAAIGLGIALAAQAAAPIASGAVLFYGLQNIAIPTDFSGVYLDIETGVTNSAVFTGWDINPFFGGVGISNSATFQPARSGTANDASIVALSAGTLIGGNLLFSSGEGGSEGHLGPALNQFPIGQDGYLGFRFTTNGGAGPFYGWMRILQTANTSGAVIKEWAYETSGLAIASGNVLQTAPVSGVSTIALSGGAGQNSTLGPLANNLGNSVALAVTKSGAGTWTIAQPGNYSSITTSGGETLVNISLLNATVAANTASVIEFGASQTLTSLSIADGSTVLLGESNTANAPEAFPSPLQSPATSVPEPGCVTLVAGACAMMLARARRR